MFDGMSNKKRVPINLVQFMELFVALVNRYKNTDIDQYTREEARSLKSALRLTLMEQILDLKICRANRTLSDMFMFSTLDNTRQKTVGKDMTKRLLRWNDPSPQMKNKLFSYLLVEGAARHPDIQLQEFVIKDYVKTNIAMDLIS